MQHVVKLRMMVCNYLEGFPCHHLYCALSMPRMSDVLMLAYNTKRIALHHYPCFFQLSKYRETNAQIKFFRSYHKKLKRCCRADTEKQKRDILHKKSTGRNVDKKKVILLKTQRYRSNTARQKQDQVGVWIKRIQVSVAPS